MATFQTLVKAKSDTLQALRDFDTGTFRVIWTTVAWDYNNSGAGNHKGVARFVSDISTHEVSAGYGTNGTKTYNGRPALTNPTLTEVDAVGGDSINDAVDWDFDDLALVADAAGFTDGRIMAVYKQGTADTDSPLLAFIDFGASKSIASDSLTVQIAGVIRV